MFYALVKLVEYLQIQADTITYKPGFETPLD